MPAELCQSFKGKNSFSRNERLHPVQSLCQKLQKEFSVRKEVVACDRVWEGIKAPKDIQQGSLTYTNFLGISESRNIRKMICESNKRKSGLSIKHKKRLFSSNYILTRSTTISGTDVKFSVNLVEPEKE